MKLKPSKYNYIVKDDNEDYLICNLIEGYRSLRRIRSCDADLVSLFFDGQILTTDTPRRFFGQNSFYTTAANRMSRCVFQNAVTAQDVTALYHINREGRA